MPRIFLLFTLFSILLAGCVRHDELISFNTEENPMPVKEEILNQMDLRIQPEDLLKIDIYSINIEAAAPFNKQDMLNQGNMNMQMFAQNTRLLELFVGYFVDEVGFVDLPVIGSIEVSGMTLSQARAKIEDLIKPYLKDAVVNMRFLNFKVTVSGEVNVPGMISLTNKRTTLLEVIGLAGDLTPYANRTNILVVREEGGQRTFNRINLMDYDVFQSPYFYVQQNDFIYVEPIQARVATVADPAQRFISYSSGVLSVITLIIALTR